MKRVTKRKVKKFFKNNKFVLFLLIIFPVFLFMAVGYAYLKTDLQLNGNAKIIGGVEKDPEDKTEVCQMGLSFELTNSWQDNYIYDVTISNNSSEVTNEWALKFLVSEGVEISTSYGTPSEKDGYIYLTSLSWTAQIQPGDSQVIQLQITTTKDINEVLDNIIVVACGRAEADDKVIIKDGNAQLELGQLETQLDVNVEMVEASAWGGIVNRYKITITNNTDSPISSWRGMIYFGNNVTDSTLSEIYAVDKSDITDVSFIFEDNGGNGTIPIGESLELDMVMYTNDPSFFPDIVVAGLREI